MVDDVASRDVVGYYDKRAQVYERIYAKPERQGDLAILRGRVALALEGRDVLELACGTGYWTAVVATRAAKILGIDINESVLDIARAKAMGPAPVRFECADLNAFTTREPRPNGGLAVFWFSHVERGQWAAFFARMDSLLAPGSRVVVLDNTYVAGSSTPISRTDEAGNTYQTRTLDDGSAYEVLKNFPTGRELTELLQHRAKDVSVEFLTHYWCLTYSTA